MQNLAIVCEKQVDSQSIVDVFSKKSGLVPQIFDNAILLVAEVNEGRVCGLVMGVARFSTEKAKLVEIIKEKLPSFPIVIASQALDDGGRSVAEAHQQFMVIKYPEELHTLPGLFEKMFNHEKVKARKFIRYDVQLPAQFSFSAGKFDCHLSNLSRGGAQMEVAHLSLDIGQEIVLYVPLFAERKRHSVTAKIVWLKKLADKTVLGVDFAKPVQ